MNKNVDLTKILKDCPKGTKFYTTVWGEVSFQKIVDGACYAIEIYTESGYLNKYYNLTKNGCYLNGDDAECIIFPSKEQRDWSNFSAPWYKNDKFDPKTLQPFDRVLVRDYIGDSWACNLFSHIQDDVFPYSCILDSNWKYCIPYNEDTKYLVGTTNEAPKFYRYWEN